MQSTKKECPRPLGTAGVVSTDEPVQANRATAAGAAKRRVSGHAMPPDLPTLFFRAGLGLQMGFQEPEVLVQFTRDGGKEVGGDLVAEIITLIDGLAKGIGVMGDVVDEPFEL